MELIFIIGFLLFAVIAFGLPMLLIRPINKLLVNDPNPKTRSSFQLSDLFSLMFLFQLPIAIVRITNDRFQDIPAIAFGYMAMLSLIAWYAGLIAANHVGISSQLKRLVVVGFTLPLAIVSGFMTLGLGSAAFQSKSFLTIAATLTGLVVAVSLIYSSAAWSVRGSAMHQEQNAKNQLHDRAS